MNVDKLLGHLPESLRKELLKEFNNIVNNFREGRWEPSELDGGKMCEVVYSILKGFVDSSYPAHASKPNDMVWSCRQLEQAPQTFSRSVRISIPRLLIALYDVRNTRGVGHVGGEVDPNHMDAALIFYSSKWILAELIRVFNKVDTKTATAAVEALVEREIPFIWKVDGIKRVLSTNLKMKEKVLILLYSEDASISEETLVKSVEHSSPAVFRRDILLKGHKARLWEYNRVSKSITISPLGIVEVETKLLSK
jgi:hypothetical protein